MVHTSVLANSGVGPTPAYSSKSGLVYVLVVTISLSLDTRLLALNATTGEEVWN